MNIPRASKFVTSIWKRARDKGYGSIQIKVKDRLVSHYFPLPASDKEVARVLKAVPHGADVYFCPLPSTRKSRKKDSFDKSRLLWADLDEASPNCKPRPTVIWETSPGRYQALWFLDKLVPVEKIEVINKNLTYSIGADKGGWDLGQILRVPYTTNYKPKYDEPEVTLIRNKRVESNFNEFSHFYKKIEATPKKSGIIPPPVDLPKTLSQQWFDWESIPEGERSEKPHSWVWSFLQKGINEEWVLRAVSEHPLTVEKYGNRAHREIQRSIDKYRDKTPAKVTEWTAPTVQSAVEFLGVQHEIYWMLKNIWMENTVGFIDGPPKVFKSWLSLDMAVSIAAGTPYLTREASNAFKWQASPFGHENVLIMQEEDPQAVVARRLSRVLEAKGFDAGGYKKSSAKVKGEKVTLRTEKPVPLYLVTSSGFSLDVDEYIEWLEETIFDLQPRLVLLDPLLTMLGDVDEFKAGEISKLLKPLKILRDRYKTSFCIVHHTHKISTKDNRRGGEQIYGSMAFHAWLESAIHIRAVGDIDESRTVEIKREFKAAEAGIPFHVHFESDMKKRYAPHILTVKESKAKLQEKKESAREESREDQIKQEISRLFTYIKKHQPVSGREIQDDLEWGKTKTYRIIQAAIDEELIQYEGSGRTAKLITAD